MDTQKIDAYAKQAKAQWGDTPEYKAFEAKKLTKEKQQHAGEQLMALFKEFAEVKDGAPEAPEAQALVKKLQHHITENFYPCSDAALSGLGKLYGAGGEFTENIDAYAGAGTARFAERAIEAYCTAQRSEQ